MTESCIIFKAITIYYLKLNKHKLLSEIIRHIFFFLNYFNFIWKYCLVYPFPIIFKCMASSVFLTVGGGLVVNEDTLFFSCINLNVVISLSTAQSFYSLASHPKLKWKLDVFSIPQYQSILQSLMLFCFSHHMSRRKILHVFKNYQ